MIKLEDFIVHFDVPDDERLLPIFELFLELKQLGRYIDFHETDDLGIIPEKDWFKNLKKEISIYGIEEYQEFASREITILTKHQIAHNIWSTLRDYDLNNGNSWEISKYVEGYEFPMKYTMPPAHYYFYASQKSRYFKGILLSTSCVWKEEFADILVHFATVCPFLDDYESQASTGLYIKDICEVISKCSKNAITNLEKIKSNQKTPQSIEFIENYIAKTL